MTKIHTEQDLTNMIETWHDLATDEASEGGQKLTGKELQALTEEFEEFSRNCRSQEKVDIYKTVNNLWRDYIEPIDAYPINYDGSLSYQNYSHMTLIRHALLDASLSQPSLEMSDFTKLNLTAVDHSALHRKPSLYKKNSDAVSWYTFTDKKNANLKVEITQHELKSKEKGKTGETWYEIAVYNNGLLRKYDEDVFNMIAQKFNSIYQDTGVQPQLNSNNSYSRLDLALSGIDSPINERLFLYTNDTRNTPIQAEEAFHNALNNYWSGKPSIFLTQDQAAQLHKVMLLNDLRSTIVIHVNSGGTQESLDDTTKAEIADLQRKLGLSDDDLDAIWSEIESNDNNN